MSQIDYRSNTSQISKLCSYLGSQILSGNVEALKGVYGIMWKRNPALIKTMRYLQECITAVEIEGDIDGDYCPEFLYYWGMACLGEQSELTYKDLGTAELCFKKIVAKIPLAESRMAFIGLLKSSEPAQSDCNVERLDILRRWASKHDLFSRIVLAKVIFYQYLCELQPEEDIQPPIHLLELLHLPCQKGHPVAIRFWNEILDYTGTSMDVNIRIPETCICEEVLFDL